MEKAFGYIRVSTKGQVGGDGFVRQSLALKEFAKSKNIQIVKIFREEGISGEEAGSKRPAWSQLLTALHSNGTKIVIVERLDRLARSLHVQEAMFADLKKSGFSLFSVAEPDLIGESAEENFTRTLLRQMMGAFAEYEKSCIVAKLKGARERKRLATGKCEGRKSYGEKPGEREILQRILEMSLEMSGNAIATKLNEEGVKTRNGKGSWFGSNIVRLLRVNSALLHEMSLTRIGGRGKSASKL